jgi:hypothetical protein
MNAEVMVKSGRWYTVGYHGYVLWCFARCPAGPRCLQYDVAGVQPCQLTVVKLEVDVPGLGQRDTMEEYIR